MPRFVYCFLGKVLERDMMGTLLLRVPLKVLGEGMVILFLLHWEVNLIAVLFPSSFSYNN